MLWTYLLKKEIKLQRSNYILLVEAADDIAFINLTKREET